MILRPGSCSWCSDQVSSLGELWHKLARLAWRRRVDKLAAGGILSWSGGLKRSNALKAANLQRNEDSENDENNKCDRWRNSLPLSRPEKLLRLVPLTDQGLRWTSQLPLKISSYSGRSYTGCFFSHWYPPKKLKYGKPRLGESTLT